MLVASEQKIIHRLLVMVVNENRHKQNKLLKFFIWILRSKIDGELVMRVQGNSPVSVFIFFFSGGEEKTREELGVLRQDQRYLGTDCSGGLRMMVNEAWLLQMGNWRKSKDLGKEIRCRILSLRNTFFSSNLLWVHYLRTECRFILLILKYSCAYFILVCGWIAMEKFKVHIVGQGCVLSTVS